MNEITINGIKYIPETPKGNDIRIVILQRGWVMVGYYERNETDCKLHKASVIRVFGTTKGLGEIAKDGPTSSTKLDPCNGLVEFHRLTEIATISCDEKKWKTHLV